jgi:hypothetical protein
MAAILKHGPSIRADLSRLGISRSLYVATTGSDSNLGLSASAPFLTVQKAFDIIADYAPVLGGTWTVNLAAGTYTDPASMSAIHSRTAITIKGPTVTHNTEPTAIIDGTGVSGHGWTFTRHMNIVLQDLKFMDWQNTAQNSGIYVEDFVRIRCNNVWCESNEIGIQAKFQCDVKVNGGTFDSNTAGVWLFTNCSYDLGHQATQLSEGCTFVNNTYGFRLWEMCSGHVDYCTFDSNTTAIYAQEHSRVSIQGGGDFIQNTTALRADISSNIQYDDSVVGLNINSADRNTTLYDGRASSFIKKTGFDFQYDRQPVTIDVEVSSRNTTGTTTETTIETWTVPAQTVCKPGDKIVVIVGGFYTGAAGQKTIRIKLDGTTLISGQSAVGQTGAFRMVGEIYHRGSAGAATQRGSGLYIDDGTQDASNASATKDLYNSALDVTLTVQLSNAADTITITNTEFIIKS